MANEPQEDPMVPDDGGSFDWLKKLFGMSVSKQRKATNKYGNAGRTQTQPGGAYADAAQELEKEN